MIIVAIRLVVVVFVGVVGTFEVDAEEDTGTRETSESSCSVRLASKESRKSRIVNSGMTMFCWARNQVSSASKARVDVNGKMEQDGAGGLVALHGFIWSRGPTRRQQAIRQGGRRNKRIEL